MDVAAELERRVAELEAAYASILVANESLTERAEQYRALYMALLERYALLERGIIAGKKAERFTEASSQLTLQVLSMVLGEETKLAPTEPTEQEPTEREPTEQEPTEQEPSRSPRRRRPGGRRPLPQHLPRIEIEVLPPEVQRKGLDAFHRIGQEIREVLERRRAALVAVRIVRPKFVPRAVPPDPLATRPSSCYEESPMHEESPTPEESPVLIAEMPELPIERGLAGPGMLADTIVRRWQDHCPLNRLEGIYARDGMELSRSTMCGWHEQVADLAEPIVDAMLRDAFTAPYLCADATGVLVKAKDQCQRAHFWVLIAPERHVLYRFSHKHDSAAVDRLLAGYKGHLVADAATVFDHLYKSGDVVEVACWAHTRRYFFKALKSDPARAEHALSLIRALYRVERSTQGSPRKKREEARRDKSRPIVDAFFQWCDAEAAVVLDDTPISKALGYARNQRVALSRFLADGRLPLDNNISERNLRREVLGRKNWIFLGSDEGARVNTIFVSLLASCQLHGIEPWAYLRDIFLYVPRVT